MLFVFVLLLSFSNADHGLFQCELGNPCAKQNVSCSVSRINPYYSPEAAVKFPSYPTCLQLTVLPNTISTTLVIKWRAEEASIENLRGFYLELFSTGRPLPETYEINLEQKVQTSNQCQIWKLRKVRYSVTCKYFGHDEIAVYIRSKPQPPMNISKEGTFRGWNSTSTNVKGIFNQPDCKSIDMTYLTNCGLDKYRTSAAQTTVPSVQNKTSTIRTSKDPSRETTAKVPQRTRSTNITSPVTQMVPNETTQPLVAILVAVVIFISIIAGVAVFCGIKDVQTCLKHSQSYSPGFDRSIRNHIDVPGDSFKNSTLTNRIEPENNHRNNFKKPCTEENGFVQMTNLRPCCDGSCSKTLEAPQRRIVQFVNSCTTENPGINSDNDFHLSYENSPTGSVSSSFLEREILNLNFPESGMHCMNENESAFMREHRGQNRPTHCRCNVDSGFSE